MVMWWCRDMMMWWYDNIMMWWCGDVMMLCYDDVVWTGSNLKQKLFGVWHWGHIYTSVSAEALAVLPTFREVLRLLTCWQSDISRPLSEPFWSFRLTWLEINRKHRTCSHKPELQGHLAYGFKAQKHGTCHAYEVPRFETVQLSSNPRSQGSKTPHLCTNPKFQGLRLQLSLNLRFRDSKTPHLYTNPSFEVTCLEVLQSLARSKTERLCTNPSLEAITKRFRSYFKATLKPLSSKSPAQGHPEGTSRARRGHLEATSTRLWEVTSAHIHGQPSRMFKLSFWAHVCPYLRPARQNAQTQASEAAFAYIHGQPAKMHKLNLLRQLLPIFVVSPSKCQTEPSKVTFAYIRSQLTRILQLSLPK